MNFSYRVERVTKYSQYTAVVEVSRTDKTTTIALFNGEPEIKIFKWFSIDEEPIKTATISTTSDVHQTIKDMIKEWEYPLYQQDRAETAASTTNIDYAEELKRERLLLKLEAEEEKQEFKLMVHDFIRGTLELDDDGMKPVPTEQTKKKIHPNSKKNLVQFRDQKAK